MWKKQDVIRWLKLPLIFVITIWIIHLVSYLIGIDLTRFGIYPRSWGGLKGVLFSPLIHGGFGHLISNTTPLLVLSAIVLFFYKRVAIPAFLMIYFLSGIAVWMFARPAYHIGASGFIYGLVTFVFWNGVFRRDLKSIALALLIVFYYGSMIFGILPLNPSISWEGHLFGALAGILAAYWFMDFVEKEEEKPKYSWEVEEESEKSFLLERDTFDKTLKERKTSSENDPFSGWRSTHT